MRVLPKSSFKMTASVETQMYLKLTKISKHQNNLFLDYFYAIITFPPSSIS